ncbi:MAG TPA: hypothetical protein VGM88_30190 [Kofleriaceae bacterium]
MSVALDVRALRTSAALAPGDHLACVRVKGDGGHALLDRVSPRELFLRTGQLLHTLLLDDDAAPVADVYLGCDEDDYLVIAEGMSGAEVCAYLSARAEGLAVELVDTSATHAFLCLGGPYAWEVLAEVTAPDVIGLPYLGFFHDPRFACFRGGKTGEYGYDLLVPRANLAAVRAQILEAGARFEVAPISERALEVAQLENAFWNARREVRPGLTPVELQLQWRVTAGREFPGSAALEARRRAAATRTVLVAAAGELAEGAGIFAGERRIGEVLHAEWSPMREDWLGLALVERPLAHAGLVGLHADGGVACRTISAPALNNRSLYVDPQRHAWATRATDAFPPLVRA